jgi:TIR domain
VAERLARDFFISYTAANRPWAEWIAVQLETAGYSPVLQAWDFRPGSDFLRSRGPSSSAGMKRRPGGESDPYGCDPAGTSHPIPPVCPYYG